MAGLGGLSKLHHMQDSMKGKEDPDKKKKGEVTGNQEKTEGAGEPMVHELHDHGDGSFSTRMHGEGEATKHPTHMHAVAHLAHHVTGGDKHHIAHHDGMSVHTHGIHESGEHDGPHEHGSANEASQHMEAFMGDGEDGHQEPDGDEGAEGQHEPAYGAM